MTTESTYDPERDHTEQVLAEVGQRIAAASLLALAETGDPTNLCFVIAENAFMTGIAVGLLAPDWARTMHEEADRAYQELGEGPSRMPGIVADITRDFPLGEGAV